MRHVDEHKKLNKEGVVKRYLLPSRQGTVKPRKKRWQFIFKKAGITSMPRKKSADFGKKTNYIGTK